MIDAGHQRALSLELSRLKQENAELRALNSRLSNILASAGPRTPNTDMIMGALRSGGDVLKLASELAAEQGATDEREKTALPAPRQNRGRQ